MSHAQSKYFVMGPSSSPSPSSQYQTSSKNLGSSSSCFATVLASKWLLAPSHPQSSKAPASFIRPLSLTRTYAISANCSCVLPSTAVCDIVNLLLSFRFHNQLHFSTTVL